MPVKTTSILALVLVLATSAFAEEPSAFPEFTFKRVKPPASGAKRITVQIQPEATTETATPSVPQVVGTQSASGFEWFWIDVSPSIEQSGPGRLSVALTTLAGASQARFPRLQGLQDIAEQHGIELLKATIGTRVSPALALAIISVESSGNASAESSAGAQGLMQLIPATAERFGVKDALVPEQNIAGGVAYLDWLMGQFDNDPILVLAAYNAGENAVRKNGGVPPYKETRGYVPKVLAAWSVARGLCLTPPELVTDGCVFAVKGG